jgi:hypothetical protein
LSSEENKRPLEDGKRADFRNVVSVRVVYLGTDWVLLLFINALKK